MAGVRRVQFAGQTQVQFFQFRQGLMMTEADGSQAFVGMIDGHFGTPPEGTQFEAQVKLTVGAALTEDAYEVLVPEELAILGAHPELRRAAFSYLNKCMSFMVGPHWARLTGLTAQNNLISLPGEVVTIIFEEGEGSW